MEKKRHSMIRREIFNFRKKKKSKKNKRSKIRKIRKKKNI